MKLVDFKQAKERDRVCGSLFATDCGKLMMPAGFCGHHQKMSRDCCNRGDDLVLAFLLQQAGCSLSVDTNSSHICYSICEKGSELKINNDSRGIETCFRGSDMVSCWTDGVFGTNVVQIVPEFRSAADCCAAPSCFSDEVVLVVA